MMNRTQLALKTLIRGLRPANRVGSVQRAWTDEIWPPWKRGKPRPVRRSEEINIITPMKDLLQNLLRRRKRTKRFAPALLALLVAVSGTLYPARRVDAASCVLQGNTITVNCEFDPGTYYYNGTFTVNSSVTVTAGNTSSPGQVVIIADDFVIDGAISANAMGPAGGSGSCPGGTLDNGGGACHGGDGGKAGGTFAGAGGTSTYGSVTDPVTLGSGGGDDTNVGGIQSGRGGGAIKIQTYSSSTGTLAFGASGSVTANGGNSSANEAGGGSGGSVWIDVGDLDVAEGTITANGGNGTGSGSSGGGGGGGGRVALHYATASGSLAQSRQAYGGNRGTTTTRTAVPGGAGTLFVWDRDDANGALTIDDNDQLDPAFTRQVTGDDYTFSALNLQGGARYLIPTSTMLTLEAGGSFASSGQQTQLWIYGTFDAPEEAMTFSNVDVHQYGTIATLKYLAFDDGTYSVDPTSALFSAGRGNRLESMVLSGTGTTTFSASGTGAFHVDAFQAKSGSTMTHEANSSTHLHSLVVSATSSIDVQSGALVSLAGRGFAGVGCNNIGIGTGGGAYQSGGSHGGDGGAGGATVSTTSTAYGSLTQPSTIGSGGGATNYCGSSSGGAGAGAVRLSASSGTVTMNGTITANGGNGGGSNGGGGGAGGSVWIEASTIEGTGTINVRGGAGSGSSGTNGGGGGGGGRIAISYVSGDPTTMTFQSNGGAFGGAGGSGGAGTIFLDDTDDANANGTLILDNGGNSQSADSSQIETTRTFDFITIRNGAKYGVPNGKTLTLPTGGAVTAGGGGARPGFVVALGGSLNANTSNWAVEGFDLETAGTVTGPTSLSFKGARLKLKSGGRFFAPVTELDFQTDSGLDLESEDPNLDLTDVTIPAGSTFNRIAGSTAPFGPNFQNLSVHGTYVDSSGGIPLFVDSLTVQSGGLVTHATNTHTTVQTQQLVISATSTISILAGGSVNVASKGFQGTCSTGSGPGAGANGGRGAGHGGNGGASGASPYGSVTEPVTVGSSGGGHNGFCSNGVSGSGGGAIKLTAGGTVLVAGTISAIGGNGAGYSAGGSGGSIWIDAGTLTGGGAITANSGTGGISGGGGGGGRIALYYDTDSATGTRSAYGVFGSAGYGGAGTIFLDDKDDALPNGTLIVNNNNASGAATTQVTTASQTYDSVDIRNAANYVIPSGYTLTVASGGSLVGGGSTRGTLTVNAGGTFDPGAGTFTFGQANVANAGTIATVTDLTVEGSTATLSGAGTFSATLTALTLRSATFTQGSSSPGMNVSSLTMTASTYNNNSTNPGLNLASLDLGSGNTFINNSVAYYPLGSSFTDLTVHGTFQQNALTRLFVDDLTVQSGGLLMHATNTSTSVQDKGMDISATSSISVLAGGTVSVAGRGFIGSCGGGGYGPGAATSASSGGGYGGNGAGGGGGSPYGSVTAPSTLGSTGSMGVGFCSNGTSGAGGGAIRLTTPGTLLAAGTITANSLIGTGYGAGSAGGSIWIDVGTLTGGGAISANGSAAGGAGVTGGGAGGRIAIHYGTDSSTGTRTAYGGNGVFGGQYGGAGTIFLDDTDDALPNGTLIVDNGNNSGANTTQAITTTQTYDAIVVRQAANLVVPSGYTLATSSSGTLTGSGSTKGTLIINSGGTYAPADATSSATGLNITNNGSISTVTSFTHGNGTFLNNGSFTAGLVSLTVGSGANWRQQSGAQLFSGSDLTIQDGGTFTQEHTGTIEVDTVTIESGGTLTHCDNTTLKVCQVNFETTTFTVQSGGTVNVDGKGFDSTTGDGQGGDAAAGGGAGYGGAGGHGIVSSTSQNNGGAAYGSATGPVDLGSGGGDDTNAGGQQGGAGGGVIRLNVTGTLTVSGTISADGANFVANEGGGGSGGSIWLTVGTLTATANIGADGGAGGGNDTTGGGCGAGGRVAIDYGNGNYSQSATTTAAAGTGCGGVRIASTGSVYLNELPANAPTINGILYAPATPSVTDSVTISASATYALGLDRLELYLDGTAPANLRHTCDFTSAVDGSCSIHVGLLSRGTHTITAKAYGDDASESEDALSFYVDGFTTVNQVGLSRLGVNAEATFSLTYTLSGTSTQDLVVTFPGGFTVTGAFTSGSGCLSNFGFTATTLTADTTDCIGTVTASGATVTNPGTPGLYTISWVDDEGESIVAIVDDDQVTVSAEVDASITFNVGTSTGTCDGSFSGNGGTAAFGTLTTSSVSTSDIGGIAHICSRVTSNASAGAIVTVRSQTGSLRSISTPAHEILSGSATLSAGTEGYGLCVGSGGSDTGTDGAGASPSPQAPFNGSCTTGSHAVGGLTTSPQTVWSINGPAQNAFAKLFLKAAVSSTTEAHNDYQDVLTFIATGTY